MGHRPAHHYTADVVVLTAGQDRRVLLIRRAADHDTLPERWALPGGHVDPGETARAAAVRELAEETGLHVDGGRVWRLVGVYDEPGRDPRGPYVTAAYTTVVPAAVPVAGGDDADQAAWVPVERALAEPLAFDHSLILRDALNTP